MAVSGSKRASSPAIPVWLQVLGAVLPIVLAIVGVTCWLNSSLNKLDRKIQNNTHAIEVIASKQDDRTNDLVKQLLAEAQAAVSAQDGPVAGKAAALSSVLLRTQIRAKTPAAPEFFQKTDELLVQVSQSQNPETREEATQALTTLAEYRSVLLEPTPGFLPPTASSLIMTSPIGGIRLSRRDVYDGGEYQFQHPTGYFGIADGIPPLLSTGNQVMNAVIRGGTVNLSGIAWRHTEIIGARVRFSGGETLLNDVRFIDCTFEDSTPPPTSLLQYAALDQSSLKLPKT